MISDYDSKEGISEYIRTLDGFNKLCDKRHDKAFIDKEDLNDFCIFGRFILGKDGKLRQASKCLNSYIIDQLEDASIPCAIPKELYPEIPNVLTHKEFWEYKEISRLKSTKQYQFIFTPYELPTTKKCPICHKLWTLENCHDASYIMEPYLIRLNEYDGLSMKDIRHLVIKNDDCHFRRGSSIWRRSINKYLEYDDNHIIKTEDELIVYTFTYLHHDCFPIYYNLEE
jgi:hypothetical protein